VSGISIENRADGRSPLVVSQAESIVPVLDIHAGGGTSTRRACERIKRDLVHDKVGRTSWGTSTSCTIRRIEHSSIRTDVSQIKRLRDPTSNLFFGKRL